MPTQHCDCTDLHVYRFAESCEGNSDALIRVIVEHCARLHLRAASGGARQRQAALPRIRHRGCIIRRTVQHVHSDAVLCRRGKIYTIGVPSICGTATSATLGRSYVPSDVCQRLNAIGIGKPAGMQSGQEYTIAVSE